MDEKIIQEIETALKDLPKNFRFRRGKSYFIVEGHGTFGSGTLKWHGVAKIKLGKHNVILIARPRDLSTKTLMEMVAGQIKSVKFTIIEAKDLHGPRIDNSNFPDLKPHEKY
jgi:hypothetical protein